MRKIKRKNKNLFFMWFLLFFVCINTCYAFLNSALMINGVTNIKDNKWDIHFENIQMLVGSINSDILPVVDNSNTTINFSAALALPGDFYGFTVDIVNAGSLDAAIESVVKTPELTEEQKKYLNYVIEYQNGDPILPNEVILKNSTAKLKVMIEYRSDLPLSEMPQTDSSFNLSFKINFVQNDDEDNKIVENYGGAVKVISGDGTQKGDEVCIRDECFYVISSTNEEVKLFAKYNLLVGYKYDDTNGQALLTNPTGLQSKDAIGLTYEGYNETKPLIGVTYFSMSNYWEGNTSSYPFNVYGEDSAIYQYVENYKEYLERLGLVINDARLITVSELVSLGCDKENETCIGGLDFTYSSSYWTGDAYAYNVVWAVANDAQFSDAYFYNFLLGVRPVIVIPKNMIS